MPKEISHERSVIVAADVEPQKYPDLVVATCKVDKIGGYKVGAALGLSMGLPRLVEQTREIAGDTWMVYDHQKAGTDIPDTSKEILDVVAKSGVDAVILFPLSGPETAAKWIEVAQDKGLMVLVGGHMTHPKFLRSEGGYIDDNAPVEIYTLVAELGVRNFVVPGNKPEFVKKYKGLLDELLGEGQYTLYAPGFITQGGDIAETGQVAGKLWHAIVGGAIYKEEDMSAAARRVVSKLS